MRRMPMGQFVPGNSVLHRLDARIKLVCLLVLLVAIIATSTLWEYLLMACVLAVIIGLSALPLRVALASVRRLWLFYVVIFAMNALFFDTTEPLWSWWIFKPSVGGITQGVNVVLHVLLLIVLTNVMTCTTSPMDITGALQSLMKPLRLINVSVDDVVMIINVAIQFIPVLAEEAEMIRKAQLARGARFESKRLSEKAAAVLPLVVPVFLSAFRRADELSVAMEARGYRTGKKRTPHKAAPLRFSDLAAIAVSACACFLIFAL